MIFKMLVDGAWTDARSGRTWTVANPATEEAVADVPFGGTEDALAAVEAARRAQPGWAAKTAYERGALLARVASLVRERADELAPIMTRECGKPVAEARREWGLVADIFDWFAEEGKRAYGRNIPARQPQKRIFTLPMPVGVAATITAWNFPAFLPARKWSAALAAGCAVVGRPSELTPLCSMALANLLVEAGVPRGVVNVVNGDPEAIGKAFLESPDVDKISFTGSQRVGRILMRGAAEGIKRLALELGGCAPVLVFDDVDPEAAAKAAVAGKFRNNGQVCISPARFYVPRAVHAKFVDAAREEIRKLVVGDGLRPGVTQGPLVTAAGRERVEAFVGDAVAKGARAVAGARRPPSFSRGYFYEPTLLTDVTPDMKLFCEEVFGPVLPVSATDGFEEALRQANDTPYGLAAFVFTRDLSAAIRAYEGLKFGMVGVNDLTPATIEGPFGGVRQSGFGREGAVEGLQEFLETKFVSINLG